MTYTCQKWKGHVKECCFYFVLLFKKKQVLDPDETANQSPDKVNGRIHTSLSGDLNIQPDVIDPQPQGVSLPLRIHI